MDKPSENALVVVIGPQKPPSQNRSNKASYATDRPLPLDEQTIDADFKTITIDLAAFESHMGASGAAQAPQSGKARWRINYPMAASIGIAALLGIVAGAAATVTLMPGASTPAVAAVSDETRELRDSVTRLSSELAVVRSALEASGRTVATQYGKLSERLERAEKAQQEPSAKLAKITETLDRIERRTASAALASPDVTGSVTSIEKQQTKPAIDGWRLVDFYAGRAVLENRVGTLYEVAPGSNLPGIGRVETIKRIDGKVVVTTPKGTITSALETTRRPAYHLPPGY